TIEAGKIPSESLGEVQEAVDICDFAVGLSRQLDGRTMPSERPKHRLMETWHPLGVVGLITAFNFPAAVWSWNTAVALVCGDTLVWKPSTMTPLTSIACSALLDRAASECGAPAGVHRLGTAGQRCTTLRRVSAHEDVADELVAGLRDVFGRLPIGDPRASETLVGPLINEQAYQEMAAALEEAQADRGEVIVGGGRRAAAG